MAHAGAMERVPALTMLEDGACPLCLREVRFQRDRDPERHRLAFVDLYDPGGHGGIGYLEAMGRIHAIDGEEAVLRDVAVFRRADELIGLGWHHAPTARPLLSPLAEALSPLWARLRLRLTSRPSLEELLPQRPETGSTDGQSRCRI